MPRGLTNVGIGRRIKRLIEENPGRYSREDCFHDLLTRYPKLKPERYWKVLNDMVASREVKILRSKGLALRPERKERKKRRKKSEREAKFYESMKKILERGDFKYNYVSIVSEIGKRWKPLPAVPDLAAVRYLSSPFSDEVELTVVEVKTEPPNLNHLSQSFRYSRFADYCYVAISKEELQDYQEGYDQYLDEAEKLGIGVISFWERTSKGKERYDLDLDPKKQTPDPIEKQEYLAHVVGIWKCMKCQTFHLRPEGKVVAVEKRSVELAGEDNIKAERFICADCQAKA